MTDDKLDEQIRLTTELDHSVGSDMKGAANDNALPKDNALPACTEQTATSPAFAKEATDHVPHSPESIQVAVYKEVPGYKEISRLIVLSSWIGLFCLIAAAVVLFIVGSALSSPLYPELDVHNHLVLWSLIILVSSIAVLFLTDALWEVSGKLKCDAAGFSLPAPHFKLPGTRVRRQWNELNRVTIDETDKTEYLVLVFDDDKVTRVPLDSLSTDRKRDLFRIFDKYARCRKDNLPTFDDELEESR